MEFDPNPGCLGSDPTTPGSRRINWVQRRLVRGKGAISGSQFTRPLMLSEAKENSIGVNSWPVKPPRIPRISRKQPLFEVQALACSRAVQPEGRAFLI